MKNISFLLFTILCLTFGLSTHAQQRDKMDIHLKSGKTISCFVDEVDSIKFVNATQDLEFIITINGEPGYNDIDFDVEPSDEEATYAVMVVDKEYCDQFESDEEIIEDDLNYFKMMAEKYSVSLEEFLEKAVLQTGKMNFKIDQLESNTSYYIYCYGLSGKGEPTSKMTKLQFTTNTPQKEDLSFEMESDIHGVEVDIKIKPSRNDIKYTYDILAAGAIIEGWPLERIYQEFINQYIYVGTAYGKTVEEVLAEITYEGEREVHFSLEENTEYIAFAMGVAPDGTINTEISQINVTTTEVLPSENKIEINITDIKPRSVKYTINTTNQDAYVFVMDPAVFWEGMSDEEILEGLMGYDLMSNIRMGGDENIAEGMNADTEYLALAFGYSAGKVTTDLVKVPFRTEPADISEANAKISFEKYFDRKEVAELYPEYAGDGVLVPVTVECSGDVDEYYYSIFINDMTDKDSYSDDMLIAALEYRGISGKESAVIAADYGVMTLLAVAKNKNGVYGPVYRELVTFTEDGVSPASEFTPEEKAKSAVRNINSVMNRQKTLVKHTAHNRKDFSKFISNIVTKDRALHTGKRIAK